MICNNNMYNDYDNETFDYYTTSTFDNRIYNYLLSRYQPEAIWNYGDTVTLTFDILDNYNSSELEGKTILINFYNDRYELLPFEKVFTPNNDFSEQIQVSIDYDTSNKYFLRGTYHCSIRLAEYDSENNPTYMDTALNMTDYLLYVK